MVRPGSDYRVDQVQRLGGGLTELVLRPVGQPLAFAPGQFAMLSVKTEDGWHRHPFTISSGSREDGIRFVVKALGNYTGDLPDLVRRGAPVVLDGPHGRFDRTAGTPHQVWVAAGVGIAPLLSWARSLDGDEDVAVDLFVSADGPSPFEQELRLIAARHPSLRLHMVDTSARPRLTPEEVLATVGSPPGALSVYLCGPTPMLREFERAVRHAGRRPPGQGAPRAPRLALTRHHARPAAAAAVPAATCRWTPRTPRCAPDAPARRRAGPDSPGAVTCTRDRRRSPNRPSRRWGSVLPAAGPGPSRDRKVRGTTDSRRSQQQCARRRRGRWTHAGARSWSCSARCSWSGPAP